MKNPFKTLSSKIVYKNPWIRVREDAIIRPDGSEGIYSVVESKDSVVVGALNDKNELFLIYSFSYPAQSWQWELPGGSCDDDHRLVASKRELAEETGITAKQWTELQSTRVCDGFMTERTTTLLARDLSFGSKTVADDHGVIAEGRFFSFAQIHKMVQEGKIDEGQTITALYLIEHWLKKNQLA
ncbi:MAG TPA: NUDIX hydrolase [Candidatus Saccharimonadales bacterium]|nr:NUDIX hydrolase [Candidatus Saccharimonadales bacterium]